MSKHQEKQNEPSSSAEREVPVLRSENSLIEQEFDSIREKFEAEMGKMEEEMSRFRSELIASEQHFTTLKSRCSSSSSSTTRRNTTAHQVTSQVVNTRSFANKATGDWIESLNSPLVKDDANGKMLELKFDLTDYKPEQIVVKTIDNRLQVHASCEVLNENSSSYREYNREFLLPSGTNTELIRSSLSADGVLTVQAPLPGANLLTQN